MRLMNTGSPYQVNDMSFLKRELEFGKRGKFTLSDGHLPSQDNVVRKMFPSNGAFSELA